MIRFYGKADFLYVPLLNFAVDNQINLGIDSTLDVCYINVQRIAKGTTHYGQIIFGQNFFRQLTMLRVDGWTESS